MQGETGEKLRLQRKILKVLLREHWFDTLTLKQLVADTILIERVLFDSFLLAVCSKSIASRKHFLDHIEVVSRPVGSYPLMASYLMYEAVANLMHWCKHQS